MSHIAYYDIISFDNAFNFGLILYTVDVYSNMYFCVILTSAFCVILYFFCYVSEFGPSAGTRTTEKGEPSLTEQTV